jgi:hypothetical protein
LYIVHLEGCCKVRINRNKEIVVNVIINSLGLCI